MAIRIGGVPEHFNYPWHYALKNNLFNEVGLDIEWHDIKGGSGAMTRMLRNNELDYALVLTEGIVKHIADGGAARIVQQFVKSPLIWGIHSSKTYFESGKPLSEARFARSRIGSGSHIMPYVLAEQEEWQINENQFVTVGNIEGAITAFEQNEADILLWEKFMTDPYVKADLVKKKGDLVSPWPCFVLAASEKSKNRISEVAILSKAVINACESVMDDKATISIISEMFELKPESVKQWYSTVEWQTSDWISSKMLENVIDTLQRVGIIKKELTASHCCYARAKLY